MSYTYQQIIDAMKREARAGETGNYTEQYTTDCLEYLNRWVSDTWNLNDWDFSKTAISFTLSANTTTAYTFGSTIGELIILGIQGKTDYLRTYTEKQYRQWKKKADVATAGSVYGYVRKGLDSSGNIKVLFIATPASDTVIEGEGKTRISKITLADVAAGTAIPYFPDDFVPLLIEGAAGSFMAAINDPRGPIYVDRADKKIRARIGTNNTNPDDDVTTPPPDYCRFTGGRRNGTGVV